MSTFVRISNVLSITVLAFAAYAFAQERLSIKAEDEKEPNIERCAIVHEMKGEVARLRSDVDHIQPFVHDARLNVTHEADVFRSTVQVASVDEESSTADASNADASDANEDGSTSTESEWMVMEATAYTAFCETGCIGVTATGYDVRDQSVDHRIIAVDPDVIPLHSTVEIEGYGQYRALDTGGDIVGDRIDILKQDKQTATQFGRKNVRVRIVD